MTLGSALYLVSFAPSTSISAKKKETIKLASDYPKNMKSLCDWFQFPWCK